MLNAFRRSAFGDQSGLGRADHGWSAAEIDSLKQTETKVARKFSKPFVSTTTPTDANAIEEEWQRFLNA